VEIANLEKQTMPFLKQAVKDSILKANLRGL
jgi:hypothetical protein